MKDVTISITGMSCAACASHIEKEVSKLNGVISADVNISTEKLHVRFDEEMVSIDKIKSTIKDSGYGTLEPIGRLTLNVDGMTCAACASTVERALKNLDGVRSASVNLTTQKAVIEFDSDILSASHIRKTISDAGYTPRTEITDSDQQDALRQKKLKRMKIRLIIASIFAIPEFYIGMAHMIPFINLPLPKILDHHMYPLNFALIQLILTIPILVVGYEFYTIGFKMLVKRAPNMDSLVAIGTGSAFLYSIFALYRIYGGDFDFVDSLYFETATVVLTLVMLGKYLEAVSKGKTTQAIKKLMKLTPKTATVLKDGQEIEIEIDNVSIDDIVLVRPGASIPVDGIVVDGISSIDESMLTGESMPVEKKPDSPVTGGSINGEGLIKFKVTKVGEDTALAQIIRLVEDAQVNKAPIARVADTVAGYFVPAVILIAIIAGIGWTIAGKDFDFVLTSFVTVLVIACPCALGLATPTAIMVGTGKGAELGILIKGGEALEAANNIHTVVLDKTGTLTEGKPTLTRTICYQNFEENQLLTLAASAEKGSEHPVALAIVNAAVSGGLSPTEPQSFTAVPGRGIDAIVDNMRVLAGNSKLMKENNIDITVTENDALLLSQSGYTLMYIAADGKIAGLMAAADAIKSGSKQAVSKLKKMGIEVIMITGDNQNTADSIAKEAGITSVLAEVLPQDKAEQIKRLQEKGKRVAMVGDGINDAPALVAADVGMAIGTGTDVAVESADVVLMRGDLNEVPAAIALSRATLRNIKQNLFWAFLYNTAGIPIAAGLLYIFGGPLLNPMLAGAAMALSSVSVVTNALRLKWFKVKTKY